MTATYDVHIETREGVNDLARVVDVLALLGLTPVAMTAWATAGGLSIDIRLESDARFRDLCLMRLRRLTGVAQLTPLEDVPNPHVGGALDIVAPNCVDNRRHLRPMLPRRAPLDRQSYLSSLSNGPNEGAGSLSEK